MLIAHKSSLKSEPVSLPALSDSFPNIDFVMCKLILDTTQLHLLLVYIPPKISHSLLNDFFENLLIYLADHPTLIVGDFNVPTFYEDALNDSNTCINQFISTLGAYQLNSILNSNQRLLDLVISNINVPIKVIREEVPLMSEDPHHPTLSISIEDVQLNHQKFLNNTTAKHYHFRKANFNGLSISG